jgi:hypothetical protein
MANFKTQLTKESLVDVDISHVYIYIIYTIY